MHTQPWEMNRIGVNKRINTDISELEEPPTCFCIADAPCSHVGSNVISDCVVTLLRLLCILFLFRIHLHRGGLRRFEGVLHKVCDSTTSIRTFHVDVCIELPCNTRIVRNHT